MKSISIFLKSTNRQRNIVALCILLVCIASQRMQSAAWNSGIIEFARVSVGVLMAVIIMTHYKWESIRAYKLPYIIWGICGLIAGVIITPIVITKLAAYKAAAAVLSTIGIYLIGFCVIYTIINIWKNGYRPKLYKPLFIVWVVMLLLMIFSRTEYWWPESYFFIFISYYLTERTSGQRLNVMKGLIDGMILGFIAIQGHALLCRPYDVVRYLGNFCNPNHNCMFLCMCLAAILAKLLFLTAEKGKLIFRIFYFGLAGVCYSLICMTICRSGYLATFVVTVFFLIAYCFVRQKKVFVRMGLLLVAIFIVMLPTTYYAVRYIPTIHPHVVFYYQEPYSEQKVHSWDERNSEKFVSFEHMLQTVFGRIISTRKAYEDLGNKEVSMEIRELPAVKVAAAEGYIPKVALTMLLAEEAEEKKTPALTNAEASNAFTVRYTIYKWYIDHLSLRGMPFDEQGFQMTEDHWIQDTHNIYLDYGINFGIPVMILFIVFIWWGIGRLVRHGCKERDVVKLSCLMIALIPPVFGLFEYSWGTGMISTVAFYMAFAEMFRLDK